MMQSVTKTAADSSTTRHEAVGFALALVLFSFSLSRASGSPSMRAGLAPPVQHGLWIRPSTTQPAVPIWGHVRGLRIGLDPLPGPRGLLRVYAPYLGQSGERMINFIAVEPIPRGSRQRGFSELEHSKLDKAPGKRFWSADRPDHFEPMAPDRPARGIVTRVGNVEVLQVFILIERFDNGAAPYLQLTFRSDRPYEVGIATFSQARSAPMASCIITATMGNYARLRRLHLARKIILSRQLWPDYRGDGFTPHARFALDEFFRTPQGDALVAATTDEPNPQEARYAPGTARSWRYTGKPATQYWRCERPSPKLQAAVNGRFVYWASTWPIPGGIAYENFEMQEPFAEGAEVWFGVTPQTPAEMGLPSR